MSPNNNAETRQQQDARARLREDFLKTVAQLHGEPVSLLTYELTTLDATFSGWKPDGTEVIVKDMTTPACIKIPSAKLRVPDLLAIEFKKPLKLP